MYQNPLGRFIKIRENEIYEIKQRLFALQHANILSELFKTKFFPTSLVNIINSIQQVLTCIKLRGVQILLPLVMSFYVSLTCEGHSGYSLVY